MKKGLILLIILLFICSFFHVSGQKEKLDSLWQAYEKAKHDTTRIKLYIDIGDVGDIPDTSMFYYQKALYLSDRALSDSTTSQTHRTFLSLKSRSLQHIGIVHKNLGSYDQAIENTLKALKIYKKLSRSPAVAEAMAGKQGMSKCYTNIGLIHYHQGSYDRAIENHLKSLRISEELSRSSNAADAMAGNHGISRCYVNIGLCHQSQGSYDKAIDNYIRSLKIFEQLSRSPAVAEAMAGKQGMSACYGNIGNVYNNQGSYDKAIENHLKSLKIFEELSRSPAVAEAMAGKLGISRCYGNIGNVYKNQGRYDRAIENYLRCLTIYKELGNKDGIATVYGNISSLNISLSDSAALSESQHTHYLREAIKYGIQSLELSKEIGALLRQNEAAAYLQEACTKLGRYKEAVKYAEIFIATRDSMFNNEKTKALAEMEAKYQAEKKENEIEILKNEKDIQGLKLKNKEIMTLVLIFSITLLSVFTLIFWLQKVQKAKANRDLVKKNLEIVESEKILLRAKERLEKELHEKIDLYLYSTKKKQTLSGDKKRSEQIIS